MASHSQAVSTYKELLMPWSFSFSLVVHFFLKKVPTQLLHSQLHLSILRTFPHLFCKITSIGTLAEQHMTNYCGQLTLSSSLSPPRAHLISGNLFTQRLMMFSKHALFENTDTEKRFFNNLVLTVLAFNAEWEKS